jgi:hypothetical protein
VIQSWMMKTGTRPCWPFRQRPSRELVLVVRGCCPLVVSTPFMPLSVVEGHKDGAVTDFDWLDTPQPVQLVHATATEEAPETVGCSGCQAPVDKAPRTKWMPFYTITVNRTAAVLIDRLGFGSTRLASAATVGVDAEFCPGCVCLLTTTPHNHPFLLYSLSDSPFILLCFFSLHF